MKRYNVFSISKADITTLRQTVAVEYNYTYGELSKKGVAQLNNHIPKYMNVHTFYDLGCGDGKLLIHMSKLNKSIKKLVGVEIVPQRAIEADKAVMKNALQNKISIIKDDLCNVNYSDASVIYISNLCFTDYLNHIIGTKLGKEVKPNTVIFASKPIYLTRSHQIKMVKVNQSWGDNSDLLMMTVYD